MTGGSSGIGPDALTGGRGGSDGRASGGSGKNGGFGRAGGTGAVAPVLGGAAFDFGATSMTPLVDAASAPPLVLGAVLRGIAGTEPLPRPVPRLAAISFGAGLAARGCLGPLVSLAGVAAGIAVAGPLAFADMGVVGAAPVARGGVTAVDVGVPVASFAGPDASGFFAGSGGGFGSPARGNAGELSFASTNASSSSRRAAEPGGGGGMVFCLRRGDGASFDSGPGDAFLSSVQPSARSAIRPFVASPSRRRFRSSSGTPRTIT